MQHRRLTTTILALCLAMGLSVAVRSTHPASADGQPGAAGEPGLATVLEPSGATSASVAEGADWFSLVLGSPRDMSEATDVGWEEHMRRLPVVRNGSWQTDFDPQGGISLLFPGLGAGAVNIGETGERSPIDAGVFRRLAFRMHTARPGRFLWWGFPRGIDGPSQVVAEGVSQAGWSTYVMDMDGDWTGREQGLRLELPEGMDDLRLDWVRLLPTAQGPRPEIAWQGPGQGNVDVYVDDNRDPTDGFALAVGRRLPDTGRVAWPAEVLPPGSYYGFVHHSGDPAGAGSYSPGALRIEPLPIVRFESPSRLTGADYASTELGRPWNMDSRDEIFSRGAFRWSWAGFTTFPQFKDGLFVARTNSLDPYLVLDVDPARPIDTARYRYLSWREHVSGNFLHTPDRLDYTNGLLTRFIYYGQYPYAGGTSNTLNDVPIWAGWNTYSVDLAGGYLDDVGPGPGPGWRGTKAGLRVDFLEGTRAFDLMLDWIRLTADPVATAGRAFPLRWTMRVAERPFTVRLRYDNDRDWANGTTGTVGEMAIGATAAPGPIERGPFRLFLPWLRPDRTDYSYTWQVPAGLSGRTYILAEADDGLSVTRWYAEVPVDVVR